MGEQQELPESCVTRAIYGGVSGFGFGAILGAVSANWSDVPKVIRNKSWPAFAETGKLMGAMGGTFAAVGAAYAIGDCTAESYRGKHDMWNGAWGGIAAGAVIGFRAGSVPAAVGAAAALAITSVLVDTTGQKLVGDGLFDDGLTPPPKIYAYPPPSSSE